MKKKAMWFYTIFMIIMLLGVSVGAEMVWPQYTTSYDMVEVPYGATTNSFGKRIYDAGNLFVKARSGSETVIDESVDLTTELNSIFASTRIRNFNSGDNVYASASEINFGSRCCSAVTERITEKYATYLQHTWRLYLNNQQEIQDVYTQSTYEQGNEASAFEESESLY